MTTLVLHANQKAVVLFRDLEVLNSLSLSWVAGQLENCAAKILEGDKIRHLVQDSCGIKFISEEKLQVTTDS